MRARLARLVAWLPDFGTLYTCAHEQPTLADQLAAVRGELRAALHKHAALDGQLQHWIDQAIRARRERDRAELARDYAEACVSQAVEEQQDLTARALSLESDAALSARMVADLTDIAEGLRDELRELHAGLAVGALRKERR